MSIPACTAGADQSFAYTTSQAVTLAGAATNSPTGWEWTMLSVPSGSTDNVGTNGSFTNGVATVQNPSCTLHNVGCYVFQLKAQNGDGWSDPAIDKENGQTLVFIRTQNQDVELPGYQAYRYDNCVINTLKTLETASGSGTDANAIHKNVADEISSITSKIVPVEADLLIIEDSEASHVKKMVYVGGLPRASDRWQVHAQDTEYTETGQTFVNKFSFRVARDPDYKPSKWRINVELWVESTSGEKPEARIRVTGSGGTDTVTIVGGAYTTAIVYRDSLTISDTNEPVGEGLTVYVDLRCDTLGGTAHLKLFQFLAIIDVVGGYYGGPA